MSQSKAAPAPCSADMKSSALALGLALALVWSTGSPTPAVAQPASPADFSNKKIILYENEKGDGGYWTTGVGPDAKPLSPDRMALRERMMKRRVLEEYTEFLSPLRLPSTLGLFASDCDGSAWASPYYDPDNHIINMCYSFIAASEQSADELIKLQNTSKLWTPVSREQLIAGLFTAVLLHETGHALFDLLNVPVFGREEDAADSVAAFIALQFGKDTARTIIKGFAYVWALEAHPGSGDPSTSKPDPTDPKYPKDPDAQCRRDPFCAFSDEHGTASQRMYNGLCLAYGGDPATFQDFVDAGWLPPERAKSCPREFQQLSFAFQKTVLPFIDPEQMIKVRAKRWFLPEELKDK
jgi:Putative metallopeptidase